MQQARIGAELHTIYMSSQVAESGAKHYLRTLEPYIPLTGPALEVGIKLWLESVPLVASAGTVVPTDEGEMRWCCLPACCVLNTRHLED